MFAYADAWTRCSSDICQEKLLQEASLFNFQGGRGRHSKPCTNLKVRRREAVERELEENLAASRISSVLPFSAA